MFISEIFEATAPRGHTVEAHGIKGFNRTPWHKSFKSTEAMLAWAEKYDAEIYGTRDLEAASRGSLAPAISEDATDLNVGDPVIITGDVEFNGATGEIESFGRNNAFLVVNLYNHGRHSFHSSDVSYNDYADSDEEEARMYDAGEFRDDFEEGVGDVVKGIKRLVKGKPSKSQVATQHTLKALGAAHAGDMKTAGKEATRWDKVSNLPNKGVKEAATLYDETKPVEESHKLPGESDEDYLDRRNAQRKKVGPATNLVQVGAKNKDQVRKNYSDTISNKPVEEAKGLKKRVRVVKGPAHTVGRIGTIGEVRHGLYKGAPKTFTVDFDDGSSIQLPGSALRLVKEPVVEFNDAFSLKKGLLVNHPLIGNGRIVGIEGNNVRVQALNGAKVYTVQRSSLKVGAMKAEAANPGISKSAETKFHGKLDKLVHDTFGKRPEEIAEDDGEEATQFFVAMYDGNENTAFVGQLLKRDGQWYERRIAGVAPYSWGSKTYQSYLTVSEIMSWIDKDYGSEGNEVEGPFSTAQEARQFAEHQYVPLGEHYAGRTDVPGFMSGQ